MDPRPLPPGFISQYDPNTQRYFYVDTKTGVSQWTHPLDPKTPSPPSVGQTSNQNPLQFPTASPNPNPQEHYPLGFTDPNLITSSGYSEQRPAPPQPSNYPPTTYGGGGGQIPQSKDYPYPQQSSSPYPQPAPQYPPQYPQPAPQYPHQSSQPAPQYPPQPSGPYSQPTPSNYPSSYGPYGGGYNPHGEAQSYAGAPPQTHESHGSHGSHGSEKATKGKGGKGFDQMGKLLLGAGAGAAGGLLLGGLTKKHHKKKHKGWKGWKGKGWKGKGWKGKGWKGWK